MFLFSILTISQHYIIYFYYLWSTGRNWKSVILFRWCFIMQMYAVPIPLHSLNNLPTLNDASCVWRCTIDLIFVGTHLYEKSINSNQLILATMWIYSDNSILHIILLLYESLYAFVHNTQSVIQWVSQTGTSRAWKIETNCGSYFTFFIANI